MAEQIESNYKMIFIQYLLINSTRLVVQNILLIIILNTFLQTLQIGLFFSFVRFQFIRLVGLEKHPVHIIGLSMGGAIATCYSATYPENVMATTLMCPASKLEFTYCPVK